MERLHAELILRLAAQFHFVVVAGSIDPVTAGVATFIAVPIPARPIPLRFATFAWRVRRALAEPQVARADLVHSCGPITVDAVDLVHVHLCQAAVFAANGGHLAPPASRGLRRLNTMVLKAMALAFERRAFRRPGGPTAIAVSARGARELQESYPNLAVEVATNAVDPASLEVAPGAVEAVRASLPIGPDQVVALVVGGDWALRGVDLVIEALVSAPSVVLWVVGRGDAAALRRLALRHGVADRLIISEPRHDLGACYRVASALVVASAYETFSLVAVEAALCGRPIIGTDVGVVPDLVGAAEEPGGAVVERSAAAIATALRELAHDPEEWARRGASAQERAQRFTYDHLVRQMAAIYERQLGLEPVA